MISSSVMAFISSSVYPRYVNSFLRRVSTRPARLRNFLRAAFARPPIFLAMRLPPSSLLLQSLRFRGHPADLPAGRSVKSDGRRLADVLVRSASMRMVDGIHRDPADLEVGLAEGLEGEPFLAGFCEGLVPAARAGDRADRRAAIRMERSELARRQLDAGPISLAHDDGLRARGADEAAPVSRHRLEIVDEGPFGDLAQRHRVPAVVHPHLRGTGVVTAIFQAPGHTAPLARVRFDGHEVLMIACDGLSVGQPVTHGPPNLDRGNTMTLRDIPEGTLVYNLEAMPGDGGRFVRAAGAQAVVVSQGDRTVVQLPSGQFRSFHPDCRATSGAVAGAGRGDEPFTHAGTT